MLEQYGEIKLKVYGRNQIKNESKLSFLKPSCIFGMLTLTPINIYNKFFYIGIFSLQFMKNKIICTFYRHSVIHRIL